MSLITARLFDGIKLTSCQPFLFEMIDLIGLAKSWQVFWQAREDSRELFKHLGYLEERQSSNI